MRADHEPSAGPHVRAQGVEQATLGGGVEIGEDEVAPERQVELPDRRLGPDVLAQEGDVPAEIRAQLEKTCAS